MAAAGGASYNTVLFTRKILPEDSANCIRQWRLRASSLVLLSRRRNPRIPIHRRGVRGLLRDSRLDDLQQFAGGFPLSRTGAATSSRVLSPGLCKGRRPGRGRGRSRRTSRCRCPRFRMREEDLKRVQFTFVLRMALIFKGTGRGRFAADNILPAGRPRTKVGKVVAKIFTTQKYCQIWT